MSLETLAYYTWAWPVLYMYDVWMCVNKIENCTVSHVWSSPENLAQHTIMRRDHVQVQYHLRVHRQQWDGTQSTHGRRQRKWIFHTDNNGCDANDRKWVPATATKSTIRLIKPWSTFISGFSVLWRVHEHSRADNELDVAVLRRDKSF